MPKMPRNLNVPTATPLKDEFENFMLLAYPGAGEVQRRESWKVFMCGVKAFSRIMGAEGPEAIVSKQIERALVELEVFGAMLEKDLGASSQ